LRLVDSVADFRAQLQNSADHLDVIGRRKIIRLLVKEILVGTDTITIRHSIPLASSNPRPTDPVPSPAGLRQPSAGGDYLLCTRRSVSSLRSSPIDLKAELNLP
jgi:site-specific DNA recombinase